MMYTQKSREAPGNVAPSHSLLIINDCVCGWRHLSSVPIDLAVTNQMVTDIKLTQQIQLIQWMLCMKELQQIHKIL